MLYIIELCKNPVKQIFARKIFVSAIQYGRDNFFKQPLTFDYKLKQNSILHLCHTRTETNKLHLPSGIWVLHNCDTSLKNVLF